MTNPEGSGEIRLVCSKCGMEACAAGELYCENYKTASLVKCNCGYEGPDHFGNYDLIPSGSCDLHG